jgi:hypothetical protein
VSALKEKIVHACNRTTVKLEVMHDGMVWPIRPGYCRNAEGKIVGADEDGNPSHDGRVFLEPLPYFAAERAKRQNPLMGSADPDSTRDFVSLIGVPKWGDDYSHLEQSDALELIDTSLLEPQRTSEGKLLVRTAVENRRGGRFRAPGRPKAEMPKVRMKGTTLDEGFQGNVGFNTFVPIGSAAD